MGFQIVCLGAANVDLLYLAPELGPFLEEWPDLRPGGEVALGPGEEGRLQDLLSRHASPAGRSGGGQAANTAWALARMGLDVALLGRVGADPDGVFLRESLAGVNLDYLIQAGASGRAYILVDPAGERTILVAPNTNDDLALKDIPLEALGASKFLHLTSFVGDGPLEVQKEIAFRLQDGPRISLDPGELYARRGLEALEGIIDHLDTLLVTEREWELLGGGQKHPHWAPPVVVIKRGARGARLLTPLRYLDFPVELVPRPVDTLGAGDVFAAGYLAGRFSGLHLNLAVRLANRAAAVSLGAAGRENYPDADFLEQQLFQLRKI
ncbi:MAG: carbohydrate kinase family protein [Deltaproteobacteria bacterium]|nr:carbohydrate kinase family protein [Deltaproteobacteria bacterium]